MTTITRSFLSFVFFGIINNILYVVILTAAHDLVPPTTPKAIILLADILPSFLLKLALPFFIHRIKYRVRIICIVALSSIGMFLTSLPIPLAYVLLGIVLASASTGLGETTFLQLCHYYESECIHGWSTGTGAAGFLGAGMFLLFTTVFKWRVDWTLRAFAIAPLAILIVYQFYLPTTSRNLQLQESDINLINDEQIRFTLGSNTAKYFNLSNEPNEFELEGELESTQITNLKIHYKKTINKVIPYIIPYMLPLMLVYFAEYTINQGVSPTLLFPIETTPFSKYRDLYVTYGTIYQIGVFISRSTGQYLRLENLYILSILQMGNLIILILQSIFMYIQTFWVICAIILFEGLLGGAGYVNTFSQVRETTKESDREFALGCVGISDSMGVVIAAIVSIFLETQLCKYQVHNDKNWCTLL
ncbi:amino acid transporter [Martiniozyma asiatica (nom. inval.)]|nr:amino acid transporter [Martiniozyma asiatica]